MKFEDTQLLQHPTVRKAFDWLNYGQNVGELKAAEVLSTYAAKPDPDAVAACILFCDDDLLFRGRDTHGPGKRGTTVIGGMPGASAICEALYDADFKDAAFKTEAERQMILAMAIRQLDRMAGELSGNDWKDWNGFDCENRRKIMDNIEKCIAAITPLTEETALAERADASFITAKMLFDKRRQDTALSAAFPTSGLPAHPVIQAAYDLVKDHELSVIPIGTPHRFQGVTAIAKLILDTGASTDPDVIAAALMTQGRYEKDAVEAISPRLYALHRQTSNWLDDTQRSALDKDGALVRNASSLSYLERYVDHYKDGFDGQRLSEGQQHSVLEAIEGLSARIQKASAQETSSGLKQRMTDALAGAAMITTRPEMKKILANPPPRDIW